MLPFHYNFLLYRAVIVVAIVATLENSAYHGFLYGFLFKLVFLKSTDYFSIP